MNDGIGGQVLNYRMECYSHMSRPHFPALSISKHFFDCLLISTYVQELDIPRHFDIWHRKYVEQVCNE